MFYATDMLPSRQKKIYKNCKISKNKMCKNGILIGKKEIQRQRQRDMIHRDRKIKEICHPMECLRNKDIHYKVKKKYT